MLVQSIKEKSCNVANEERGALVPDCFDFLVAWEIKGSLSGIIKETGDKNFDPSLLKKNLTAELSNDM